MGVPVVIGGAAQVFLVRSLCFTQRVSLTPEAAGGGAALGIGGGEGGDMRGDRRLRRQRRRSRLRLHSRAGVAWHRR